MKQSQIEHTFDVNLNHFLKQNQFEHTIPGNLNNFSKLKQFEHNSQLHQFTMFCLFFPSILPLQTVNAIYSKMRVSIYQFLQFQPTI